MRVVRGGSCFPVAYGTQEHCLKALVVASCRMYCLKCYCSEALSTCRFVKNVLVSFFIYCLVSKLRWACLSFAKARGVLMELK